MRLSLIALVLALVAHLILIAGQFLQLGPIIGTLLGLPLLIVVFGLIRRRTYTAAWGSLMMLVYLGGWSMEAFGMTPAPPLIWTLCLSSVAAFVSDLLFVKWAAVEARAMPAAQTESSGAASR